MPRVIVTSRSLVLVLAALVAPVLYFASGYRVNDLPWVLDYKSLSVIMLFLLVSRGFVVSGLSSRAAGALFGSGRSNWLVLALYSVSTMTLAMLATNDGAVLVMIPVALELSRLLEVDPAVTVTIGLLSANTGSILLPFSNPQNIIIWQDYSVTLPEFAEAAAPYFILLLLLLLVYTKLLVGPGKRFGKLVHPRVKVNSSTAVATVTVLLVGVALSDMGMGFHAFILALIVYIAVDRYVIFSMDWMLALLFALLFVDFNSAARILSSHGILSIQSPLQVYIYGIALSQAVSNVPATMILVKLTDNWKALIPAVNIAGYATPVSSMANLIGLRMSGVEWVTYISKSIFYTTIAIVAGAVLLLLLH